MITCTDCQKQLTTVKLALEHRAEHQNGVHLLECDVPRCSFVTVDRSQLQAHTTRGNQYVVRGLEALWTDETLR